MAKSQTYRTRRRKCDRCQEESQSTEKVSARILKPSGGYLCPDCILPATYEATVVNEGQALVPLDALGITGMLVVLDMDDPVNKIYNEHTPRTVRGSAVICASCDQAWPCEQWEWADGESYQRTFRDTPPD